MEEGRILSAGLQSWDISFLLLSDWGLTVSVILVLRPLELHHWPGPSSQMVGLLSSHNHMS